MNKKTLLNFWLDLVSLLVMIGLIMTGVIIRFILKAGMGRSFVLFGLGRHDYGRIHFWCAAILFVLLVLHIVLHWDWICRVVGRAFGNNKPSRSKRLVWSSVFVAGIVLLCGGGLLWASGSVKQIHGARGRYGRNKAVAHCPAAERINGRSTLLEIAEASKMSVEQLKSRLKLPESVDPDLRLGPLKRLYGLSIHEVRGLVCRTK